MVSLSQASRQTCSTFSANKPSLLTSLPQESNLPSSAAQLSLLASCSKPARPTPQILLPRLCTQGREGHGLAGLGRAGRQAGRQALAGSSLSHPSSTCRLCKLLRLDSCCCWSPSIVPGFEGLRCDSCHDETKLA